MKSGLSGFQKLLSLAAKSIILLGAKADFLTELLVSLNDICLSFSEGTQEVGAVKLCPGLGGLECRPKGSNRIGRIGLKVSDGRTGLRLMQIGRCLGLLYLMGCILLAELNHRRCCRLGGGDHVLSLRLCGSDSRVGLGLCGCDLSRRSLEVGRHIVAQLLTGRVDHSLCRDLTEVITKNGVDHFVVATNDGGEVTLDGRRPVLER